MHRGERQAWASLGAAAVGWGVASPLVRIVIERGASASAVVAVRLAIMALLVAAVGLIAGVRPDRAAWKAGILVGIPRLALTPLLFISALAFVGASFQSVMLTFIPAVTSALAWVFLKEKLSLRQVAGLALGLVGIIVLILGGESGTADGSGDTLVGGLLALGGVMTASITGVMMRGYAPRFDTAELGVPMFTVGGAMAVAASPLAPGDLNLGGLDSTSWWILVALALVASLLPFWATLFSSRHLPAAQVAITAYAAPLISLALGIVLVGEPVTVPLVIGGGLAVTGMLLVAQPSRRTADAKEAHPATRA